MQNNLLTKRVLILLIVSYVFFLGGNSILSLTDPDETFYALTSKEMMAKGEWLTPHIFGQPQFEKPILTYWLLNLAFQTWGITPFAARFFPALFAMFGVLGVYALGLLGFARERQAFTAAFVLATSAFFVAMGKTVFTDMIFTVFILYSFLSFFWGFVIRKHQAKGIILFFVFAALATLTKGPLGLLIPAAAVALFLMYRKQFNFLSVPRVLSGVCVYLALALPWYLYMYQQHGQAFIHEFFYNDHWRRVLEAEHKGNDRWFFYPVTLCAGLFPWSLFLIAAFADLYKRLKTNVSAMDHFVLSWLIAVLVVFQPAHSKLASYVLPAFPALALLAGNFIADQLDSRRHEMTRLILLVNAGAFTLLGAALFVAHGAYQKYVPELEPVYFLSAALITLAGFVVTLVFKNELRWAMSVQALALLPVLWTAFLIRQDLEPYVSSYEASQYLPRRGAAPTVVMTSKPYARGTRFYTGQDVAVMNINGGNYFSPHPVPILTTDEQVLEFLDQQKTSFAYLKRSHYEHLVNLCKDRCEVEVLKRSGYNYVLKVEAILN